MTITFTDEELENYFRLQNNAEEYINRIIRKKRIEQMEKNTLSQTINREVSEDWVQDDE